MRFPGVSPGHGKQGHLAAAGPPRVPAPSIVMASRNSQVTNSASSEAATEIGPLVWSKTTIHTGNVWYRSRLAMVYSPSTSATVSTVADSSAVVRLGSTTRHSVDGQPAPSEFDASTSVLRSNARRPASIDRYANGMARTTYASASRYGVLLRKPGATCSSPTISTTGGMTIGRIVIPSSSRRSRGSRRCT